MNADPKGSDPAGDDELARQRRKRRAVFVERLMPGPPGTRQGRALWVAGEAGGALDVERFLAEQGHGEASESMRTYLASAARHPSQANQPVEAATILEFRGRRESFPVEQTRSASVASSGVAGVTATEGKKASDEAAWRLRAVERLRAMLPTE